MHSEISILMHFETSILLHFDFDIDAFWKRILMHHHNSRKIHFIFFCYYSGCIYDNMHISTKKFNCIATTPLSIRKPSQWDIFHEKFDFIHHYNFRLYIRETLSIRSKVFIALTATGSDPGSLASFSRSWITLSKDIGIGNSTGLDALCFVEKLKIVFNIF